MERRRPSSITETAKSIPHVLPGPEQEPPAYGILTRTLIHSPVVKQIISARIRSRNLNDVLFIGETFIDLYLLGDDGKLRKEATKADFQASIRHARVFDVHSGEGATDRLLDDAMVEDTKGPLPPQMLALTLDSGQLGFLYAISRGKDVDFILSTRKIDSKGVHPKHLGKSLAIDPRSRCLAVTAYQDVFRMFALYGAEELERQVQAGMPLNPIKEEKTFSVSGVILHMEFLHPAATDTDHVMMILFIVDPMQNFRLMLYEWIVSRPLSSATRSGQNGLPLSSEVSFPLHIIPLLVGTAFLIISEFCIHVARATDIISGNSLARVEFPQVTSDGGRQSLVTSWARPLRTPSHTQTMDDLYLAMEDGDIYFVEVGLDGPNLVQLVNKAGHLDCAIGSAFASLDYGLEKSDLLVAGGEMSSGGVYLKIGPSSPISSGANPDEEPELGETVANWSPVFDFDLINPTGQGHVQGRAVRDRMYACTGRGEHGAIAEIRYGIPALIRSSAEYLPGIRNIWILPDEQRIGFFLLCAFPDRSTLCFLNHHWEWEDVSELELLDMFNTTLAASVVSGRSVQITPKAVNVNILKGESLKAKRESSQDITMEDGGGSGGVEGAPSEGGLIWSRQCGPEDFIVGAAIKDTYLVIAVRSADCIKMTLTSLLSDIDKEGNMLKQVGMHIELQEDPSFVSIIELTGQVFVIVGTREATLQFYLLDPVDGLIPMLEESMLPEVGPESPMVQGDLFICESAVLIKSSTTMQLLCGLRDGALVVLSIAWSSGSLQLERTEIIQFGPIPVQVLPHVHREDTAFVLAGPELYQFKITGDEVAVSQTVFEGTTIEPALTAVAQIDNSPSPENAIICATKDQIFYAELGDSEKVCVRRLPVFETPRRVLYHKPLNLLIVACSKSPSVEAVESYRTSTRRKGSSSTLCFLNPRSGESKGDLELRDSSKGDLIFGKANEQIYGLTEWNIEVDSKSYRYIAIGTGFINISGQQTFRGRVIILSVTANASGQVETRRRFQIPCDAPVYSMAAYAKQSLLYCTGNKLCMRTLNPEAKKLDSTAEIRLRSPAVQITVDEPFINLSCASDSLCVIKFEGGELHRCYSDEVARNGFSHFSPLKNVFIVSDKQYGIAGLWQPPDNRNTASFTTIFDTEVTSSISRIRAGYLRPPWNAGKPRPGVLAPDRDIIGSGVDGSIFHLTILNLDSLRLLRYIQSLYSAQMDIQSDTYPRATASSSVVEDPRPRQDVDGDLLQSVLGLGEAWLRRAVENEEQQSTGERAGMGFAEMADSVLGQPQSSAPGDEVLGSVVSDPFVRALQYIRRLLDGVVL